jgi:hypothetical protein
MQESVEFPLEQEPQLGDRKEKKVPRISVPLPLEYRKRNDASPQAGFSGTLDEGVVVYSSSWRSVCDSGIRHSGFFPNEYELDSFKAIAAVTWKKAHIELDWKGYKYGLKFIHVSQADREKLKLLLHSEMADQLSHGESDPGMGALA